MKRYLAVVLVLPLLLGGVAFGGAERDELLNRLPADVNSVAVINVGAMYKSPRAQREAWLQQEQLANAIPMPGFIDIIVTGSHWMPGHLNRQQMFAQARLLRQVQMENLAKQEHATVEELDGHKIVETQQRGLFVQLDPVTVGALNPPQKRDLSRWLKFATSNRKPAVSDYLTKAVRNSGSRHVAAAVDLEDMIDLKAFRAWLVQTQTLKNKKNEIDPTLKMLGTLQGLRFNIQVEDQRVPLDVHFDFSDRPGVASGWIKPLFLEAIEEMGLGIEEFKQAQASVEGNSVTIRANLTDAGLGGILSLILGPTLNRAQNQPVAAGGANDSIIADATRRYYLAIQKYLGDLQTKAKLLTNYNTAATWHDTYAKQIDQLSLVNVDPDMQKFGAEISRKLKVLSGSLRGVPVEVGLLQGQKRWVMRYNPPVYNYGYGPWGAGRFGWGSGFGGYQPGSFNYDDNFAQVRTAQSEAIAKGAQERNQIWKEIEDERNQIRSKMTQKYGAAFETPMK